MDNASGVAAILEVARSLHDSDAKPARSILFVAVTGEEKGELGSRYFAAHPTVPQSSIVANVNTDMFLPLFPLKMLMVLGLDESDLGGDIRATAKAVGVTVQADPGAAAQPLRAQRSVQLRQGRHSGAGDEGRLRRQSTPEAAIARKWTAERYHAPSDDLNQPIDRSRPPDNTSTSSRDLARPDRQPDGPAQVERLQLLQALRRRPRRPPRPSS